MSWDCSLVDPVTRETLEAAISKLGNDVDKKYWEATEGNAKKALYGLLALAKLRPDGIWEIS